VGNDLFIDLAASARRVPTQRRSRERVERMLAIATALIAERGSDALRMSEVAERAGVSIGSLYQYFPDKSSIIQTLAERYNEQGRACVEAEFAVVETDADLEAAIGRVIDGYYAMFLEEPVMRDIWWATQADKALQAVDTADIETHTAMLRAVLTRLRPGVDAAELTAIARLATEFIATAVRLAISVDSIQGNIIIATAKQMIAKSLLNSSG